MRFGKAFAPDWMRRYILLKRITGLRQGDMLRLTPANVTDRGLELVTGKTKKRMRFRWSWGLRIVIDSIVASQGDVKKLALFPARHDVITRFQDRVGACNERIHCRRGREVP